jgi:hypothetical protein
MVALPAGRRPVRVSTLSGVGCLVIGVALSIRVEVAHAQEPGPTTPQETTRPGRFRLGPVYVTPYIHIGAIGLDTNVFYSATDRRTDATGSGGPGLRIVLPVRQSTQLLADGTLDYLYFLRTRSQRRLTGTARARAEWSSSRTRAGVEESYRRTYSRPSFEVDRRVLRESEATRAELKHRLFGRVSVLLEGMRTHVRAESADPFLGADLQRSLNQETQRGGGGFEYALTVKTSLAVHGDYQTDRFPLDSLREADSVRFVGGLRTDETALISGHALAGVRWFRPRQFQGQDRRLAVVDIDAMLNLSPKTRLGGSYVRDINYSAFTSSGGPPTLRAVAYGGRIEKDLVARLDLRLTARVTRLTTHHPIVLLLPGAQVVQVRDDTAREASADLGHHFRQHLRIGVAATLTDRRSTISHFGIRGLLVGATVTYSP